MRWRFIWLVLGIFSLLLTACNTTPTLPTQVSPDGGVATSNAADDSALAGPTERPALTFTPAPTVPVTPTARRVLPTPLPTATPPPPPGQVRVIHAVPGADPVNWQLDEREIASVIGYSRFTAPIDVEPGAYTASIYSLDNPNTPLLTQPISVQANQTLVLVYAGTPDQPRLFGVTEDKTPLAGQRTRLAVFNGFVQDGLMLVQEDNAPLTPGLPFTALSPTFTLPSETTELSILNGSTELLSYELRLRERESLILFVIPQEENPDEPQVILFDNRVSGLGTLRVINGLQDTEPVDVYLGQMPVAEFMGLGDQSESMVVVEGTQELLVYETGVDPAERPPVARSEFYMNPDETLTLFIIGTETSQQIYALREDVSPTPPDAARVTFINGTSTYPVIEVTTRDLSASLYSGDSTQPILLNAGSYNVAWTETLDDEETLRELEPNLNLEPGTAYVYMFTGEASNEPFVYEREVGTEAPIVIEEGVDPTPITQRPTQLRAVNLIPELTVEFRLDDSAVTESLPYGVASPAQETEPTERIVTVHNVATGALVAREVVLFEPGITTSLYVHPQAERNYRIHVNYDVYQVPGIFPAIRLINLSDSGSELTLAASPQRDTAGQMPPVSARASVTDRRSQPFGLEQVVNPAEPFEVTVWRETADLSGVRELFVIDNARAEVYLKLPSVQFQNGQLYEAIVRRDRVTNFIEAVIVNYESP